MLPKKVNTWKFHFRGSSLIVGVPYFWLLVFFLCPCLILLKISFADSVLQIPPYSNILKWINDNVAQLTFNFANYRLLFTDDLYVRTFTTSVVIAANSAFACLLIGYPMAYAIVRSRPKIRMILLMLIVLPFWTSFLIRVYSWVILLAPTGLINKALMYLGIIDQPLKLMGNYCAVAIGIVYTYLPFMVLPIYSSLEKIDNSVVEAAYDLGCTPTKAFFSVILPLSMRGVATGFSLVFMPAIGEYVMPEILGDVSTVTIGRIVWSEFFTNLSWPVASALSVMMIIFVALPVTLWYGGQQSRLNKKLNIHEKV
ncbi:MAG: ABC transporter permease subunit [Holosporales bacterium]|jgi:putrescine transport system permease protein|nr:ABC transporter permease subunit [Holosporales bacterium]